MGCHSSRTEGETSFFELAVEGDADPFEIRWGCRACSSLTLVVEAPARCSVPLPPRGEDAMFRGEDVSGNPVHRTA